MRVYAELLLDARARPITEDQRRDLQRIRQNQQHLLEIITDILNFSRIEAVVRATKLQPVRVIEVLERMEGVIEPQARARSLTYEYVEPDVGLSVTADREKLEQGADQPPWQCGEVHASWWAQHAHRVTPRTHTCAFRCTTAEWHRKGATRIHLRAIRAARASPHAHG
jgi:crotonobetainyl-CoA:carnitine CoA-transferase CaiB-like acyl-CoA transferase